ncbi:hypothetical protein D3C77_106100 [compost metagenome]
MTQRFTIPRGTLISPVMSADYLGALVSIRYFDADGDEIDPSKDAILLATRDAAGTIDDACAPIAAGTWSVNGPVVRFRVDLVGTGATTAEVDIWRTGVPDTGLLPQLFVGDRAMTVQSYIEANTKRGVQFYIQHGLPQLVASTGVYKLKFTTGAKPVLIKSREMYGNGERFQLQIFKQPPSTTGGTPVTVQNFNDVNPVATTVSVLGGVTAADNGTSWGDPQRIFSQSAAGQRAGSGLAPGGDRVLKVNSTYLVVFSNTGSGTADIDYFLSWYEGAPDLPLR